MQTLCMYGVLSVFGFMVLGVALMGFAHSLPDKPASIQQYDDHNFI